MNCRKHLLIACLAAAPFTQTAVTAQSPTYSVETRLVEVPVVVRDQKSGRTIDGLTASDFVLLENGKPQKIEFFNVYQTRGSVEPLRKSESRADSQPPVFTNRRNAAGEGIPVVAVLIDGYNSRFEDQYHAAQAAARIIESREHRALWSVYFLGRRGVRVLHDYSTNTESVVDRLRRLRASGNATEGLGAEAGDWRPYGMTDLERRASEGGRAAEEDLRAITTLASLRDIARHLSSLPGRKNLIWLTAGLPLPRVLLRMPHLWPLTLDTFNDANVAVYSIDSEGVRTSRGYAAETMAGRSVPRKVSIGSPVMDTHILSSLSEATGGRWFLNSNDLAKAVDESLADAQTFYRLAYRATREKWDGSKVALQVKIPGRKDLDIRHRLSYFARPLEPLDQRSRDRLLADAITSPLEAVEIGVTARIQPIAGSNESMLKLTLDPGSVTLKASGDRYEGRFDFRCVQTSVESKPLDDFTDEVNLNLRLAEAERTHEEGFHYQRRLRIQQGTQTLRIAFCDHVTGRLGSLRVEVAEAAGTKPAER
jgi:VWFA-related protein